MYESARNPIGSVSAPGLRDNLEECTRGRERGPLDSAVVVTHDKPDVFVCDNGPEFTCHHFLKWAARHRIDVQYIELGKPIQNAFAESFNGRMRDERLNAQWCEALREARAVLSQWHTHYNECRPHSALDYLTPNDFRID